MGLPNKYHDAIVCVASCACLTRATPLFDWRKNRSLSVRCRSFGRRESWQLKNQALLNLCKLMASDVIQLRNRLTAPDTALQEMLRFVMERIKRASNARQSTRFYFWRTYDQKEIDLIEDRDGHLAAFECKWSPDKRVKAPTDWTSAYPDARRTDIAAHSSVQQTHARRVRCSPLHTSMGSRTMKNRVITVKGAEVTIAARNAQDYISLADIPRAYMAMILSLKPVKRRSCLPMGWGSKLPSLVGLQSIQQLVPASH